MQISTNNNIGALVAEDYRTATIFRNSGIDFCCNGNRTIGEACADKNLDSSRIISDLIQIMSTSESNNLDFKSFSPDFLVEYIEKKHHAYVEKKIIEIKPFLEKIAHVHGKKHPELFEIKALFNSSAADLTSHMKKEELILFPYIKKLFSQEEFTPSHLFDSVTSPIQMMHEEHDQEGVRFRRMSELSNNFTPPEDGCSTYKVTFAMLQEFEEDLQKHIHLENNILFPKAIELEQQKLSVA
jgi:regulator of cell morphogenesis and NO signaling